MNKDMLIKLILTLEKIVKKDFEKEILELRMRNGSIIFEGRKELYLMNKNKLIEILCKTESRIKRRMQREMLELESYREKADYPSAFSICNFNKCDAISCKFKTIEADYISSLHCSYIRTCERCKESFCDKHLRTRNNIFYCINC